MPIKHDQTATRDDEAQEASNRIYEEAFDQLWFPVSHFHDQDIAISLLHSAMMFTSMNSTNGVRVSADMVNQRALVYSYVLNNSEIVNYIAGAADEGPAELSGKSTQRAMFSTLAGMMHAIVDTPIEVIAADMDSGNPNNAVLAKFIALGDRFNNLLERFCRESNRLGSEEKVIENQLLEHFRKFGVAVNPTELNNIFSPVVFINDGYQVDALRRVGLITEALTQFKVSTVAVERGRHRGVDSFLEDAREEMDRTRSGLFNRDDRRDDRGADQGGGSTQAFSACARRRSSNQNEEAILDALEGLMESVSHLNAKVDQHIDYTLAGTRLPSQPKRQSQPSRHRADLDTARHREDDHRAY